MVYTNDYQDIVEAKNGDKEKMTSLIKNNMGLVYSITRRFQGRGYDIEDLNQIGVLGLIKSIKNFNTQYDVKLSTYSVPYILGEVKRYIRDDGKVKVSRSVKELATRINAIKREYLNKTGENIRIEDIAQLLNVPKDEIILAIDATSSEVVMSIDENIYNNDGDQACLADIIQSERNEENEITNKLAIKKLIDELDEREKKIIILRYFKGKTQTEVAKKIGISQVQISRIEKKVLTEMRIKII